MKTKKNLVLLAASALIAGGSLVSCNGDSRTQVIFWHTLSKANQNILDRMITEFEAENPDIHVVQSSQGGYTDVEDKLKTAIASGDVPTMAFCYPDHVAGYLESNAVLDLTNFINDPETGFTDVDGYHMDGTTKKTGVDDFIEGYWSEGNNYSKSGIYSVPYSKSTELLFYNKTAFEDCGYAVPTTWDEMWTLTARIVQDNGGASACAANGFYALGYDSDSNFFITMAEQMGFGYTTNESINQKTDHIKFNNPEAKAFVTSLIAKHDNRELITKGSMPSASYSSTLFTAGNCLMSIGSTGGTSYNDSKNFEVGIAPLPSVNNGGNGIITQGPSICFLRRTTEAQRLASWKFYKYISNATNSATYGLTTGYDPVRYSSYETEEYLDFLTSDNIFRDVAAVTTTQKSRYFSSPVFVGSSTARTQVGGIISNVLLGAKTVDQAFLDAYNATCLAL